MVVRIARVEMGQGTLTGLAQLVAEELECDWAKVTTEYPTPGQNVARSRVWGNFQTAGSQGIRQSHEYVRKGGAAARMMLVQAAANEWKVEPSSCTVAKGVITPRRLEPHDHLRQGRGRRRQARSAEGRAAEGHQVLDHRRQAAEAARHAGEGQRQARLRDRRQAPRHAERRDEEVPGVRRQDQELRRRQGREDAGRQEGRAGRRHRRRGRRRHLVARQDRARCIADRMGQRTERERAAGGYPRRTDGRSDRRQKPSSATRTATPRARSPAPHAPWKPSTACRGSTTSPWSR